MEQNLSEPFGEIIFSRLRVSSSLDALALNCSLIDSFIAARFYDLGLSSSDTALLFLAADYNLEQFLGSTNG